MFVCCNIYAQTNIIGGNVDGTWLASGSPYLIMGNIMVPNNSTLTIEPGVTINFQGAYKLYVQGRIVSIGNLVNTIVFTCQDTINGWRGIRFDNTQDVNDTSRFSYCKFQYGKATGQSPYDNGGAFYFNNYSKVVVARCYISNCTADNYGGSIYCINSSPTITNNTILNSSASRGGGIYCLNSNPTITSNTILSSSASIGGGIYCLNSSPKITSNIISNNISDKGGGLCCENSFQEISNNTITNNFASLLGGGIYCHNSTAAITSNNISYNETSSFSNGYGGGIYCRYGSPEINNNTISYNYAYITGGGIDCMWATVTNNSIFNNSAAKGGGIESSEGSKISYNKIFSNQARTKGGGISCNYDSLINNNKITYNSASSGGGIYCDYYCSSPIYNNLIVNNFAKYDGGGIFCSDNSSPTFINNVIANNSAIYGGAIYCTGSIPSFTNNTISFNDANQGGALYCYNYSDPLFYNTIIYDNTASISGSQVFLNNEECDPDFYYCDIHGSSVDFELNGNFYTGIYQSNIDYDPLFVLPSGGSGTSYDGVNADWSLQSNSLCINKGNPDGIYPLTDITDNLRVDGDTVDIGAYEFQETENRFVIFPNPATNEIKILGFRNGLIEMFNMEGKIVKTFNKHRPEATMDISKLSAGVYVIKITTEKGTAMKKLIKR